MIREPAVDQQDGMRTASDPSPAATAADEAAALAMARSLLRNPAFWLAASLPAT